QINTNHAAVKARTIGARAHRYQSMASKKTITKPRALNSPRDHTTVIVIKEPTQVINHKSNHQRPLRHGCVTPSNMDKANKNQATDNADQCMMRQTVEHYLMMRRPPPETDLRTALWVGQQTAQPLNDRLVDALIAPVNAVYGAYVQRATKRPTAPITGHKCPNPCAAAQ